MTHLWGHKKIGEILIAKGYVDSDSVMDALKSDTKPIGKALLLVKHIDAEQLAEALASQGNVSHINLDEFSGESKLFQILTLEQCSRFGVLPLKQEAGTLYVAVADPFDLLLAGQLERISGMRIKYMVASAEAILAALERVSGGHAALKGISDKLVLSGDNKESERDVIALDEKGGESSSPVIELVNKLLLTAIRKRASDVHIEAHDDGVSVRYRIDGVLTPALETIDLVHHNFLVARLKVMADLDITEKRIPQDGRFNLRVQDRDIDFRISVLPSDFGEDVVIRILDRVSLSDEMLQLSLDDLGFDKDTLARLRRSIEAPHGMILISGPTGSGKTTTLYAALNELNLEERKVITVEDPVEYQQ